MGKMITSKPRKPPLYYVTMCDMFNLLLAFYICMVAMADTRAHGLMSTGKGTFVKKVLTKGQPGIGTGELEQVSSSAIREGWWIPDQKGDPDELQTVTERLERELQVKFRRDEATISYGKDALVVRMPARIDYDEKGSPKLTPAVMDSLRLIADIVRRKPGRHIRVSGDVPKSPLYDSDLLDSAQQGQLAFYMLTRQGVPPNRISLWGWGSTRPLIASNAQDVRNRSLTLEIYEEPVAATDTSERKEPTGDSHGR